MKLLSLFSVLLFSLALLLIPNLHDNVQVQGNHLLVDNSPFYIKGICYHPVPKG